MDGATIHSMPLIILMNTNVVGNMKRGRYWVTLSGKHILSVYEIIEFTGDRFILNDNDPRYKSVYKANKRTKLSKLMKIKSRSKKDKLR